MLYHHSKYKGQLIRRLGTSSSFNTVNNMNYYTYVPTTLTEHFSMQRSPHQLYDMLKLLSSRRGSGICDVTETNWELACFGN